VSASEDDSPLARITRFLEQIGIAPIAAALPTSTLLPGVTISAGQLLFDRTQLTWPGDLLHEAGHIAVMPGHLRAAIDATVPESDAVPHAGEVEATAWAFAATVAIGLDPTVLFHDGGYHGHAANLAFSYSVGSYPGAAGLQASGMTLSQPQAKALGLAPYPHMISWLRA
jgi:hypothetical protein